MTDREVLQKLCDQLKAMRHSMFLHPSGGQHYSYLDRDEVYACVEQALAAAPAQAECKHSRQYINRHGVSSCLDCPAVIGRIGSE
jgi:hypothetical protein